MNAQTSLEKSTSDIHLKIFSFVKNAITRTIKLTKSNC